MNKNIIEEILKERITLNASIFNEKEVETILYNINIFDKIYLLGIIDSKNAQT